MRFFAYLDPGSASALLAAVLAGIAGIGAALRTYGKNFLDKLMFWKKSEPGDGKVANGGRPEDEASPPDTTSAASGESAEPAEPAAAPPAGDRPPEQ